MHGTKVSEFSFVGLPKAWNFLDLTGQRYGRLVVEGYVGKSGKHVSWGCLCDCGGRVAVLATNIRKGNTTSCGCVHSEKNAELRRTHGRTNTSEYWIHQSMVQRCAKPKQGSRHHVRGIRVCERWLNGENSRTGFECFLEDMGLRPSVEHSIDREDNDGDYEPSNCRWATRVEQNNNTTRNVFVQFGGERLTVSLMARKHGIKPHTLADRLRKGWPIDRAMVAP